MKTKNKLVREKNFKLFYTSYCLHRWKTVLLILYPLLFLLIGCNNAKNETQNVSPGISNQTSMVVDFGDKRPIPKVGQKWIKKTISNGEEEINRFAVIEVTPSFYKMKGIFEKKGIVTIGHISYKIKDGKCYRVHSFAISKSEKPPDSEMKFTSTVAPGSRSYVAVSEMPFTEEYEETKSISGFSESGFNDYPDQKGVEYRRVTYESLGQEQISIPAGSFHAEKIKKKTELKNRDGSFLLYETKILWRNDQFGGLKVHIINHKDNDEETLHERINHEGFDL